MYIFYNPAKFFKDGWNHPKVTMVLGVTRKGISALTASIMWNECTGKILQNGTNEL